MGWQVSKWMGAKLAQNQKMTRYAKNHLNLSVFWQLDTISKGQKILEVNLLFHLFPKHENVFFIFVLPSWKNFFHFFEGIFEIFLPFFLRVCWFLAWAYGLILFFESLFAGHPHFTINHGGCNANWPNDQRYSNVIYGQINQRYVLLL